MKSLEIIQKTFKVFKTLAKIAMILSFVVTVLALVGVGCAMVWRNGGTVIGAQPESMMLLTEAAGMDQMIGELLSDAVFALTDGLLCLFAFWYFKAELADGTPFTRNGADRVKRLGIQIIVMPLMAIIISSVIYSCFGLKNPGDWDNAASVALGVALILVSLIFRYGAELEEGRRS